MTLLPNQNGKQKPGRPGSHLVLSEAVMDTNLGGGKRGVIKVSPTREDMDLTVKTADKGLNPFYDIFNCTGISSQIRTVV